MLTVERFKAMADSYGGDLRRWPKELRREAQVLSETSAQAGAVLEEARRLDATIEAARKREQLTVWRAGDEEAALARLRSGVAARIASPLAHPTSGVLARMISNPADLARSGAGSWTPLGFAGLAAAGGVAVVVGLLVGSLWSVPAAQDSLLTALVPSPLHMLVN